MKIYETNRGNTETGRTNTDWQADSKSKEYQNQIADAQSRLKDLAVNKELGEDEKAKKRKEIQQQIKELNQQLRQRQIQMQREAREKKTQTETEKEEWGKAVSAKEETKQTPADAQNAMRAVLSVNSSLSHAQMHGNMALEMEGRVRVLQNEIKQDIRYGKDTAQKKKELESLEKKAVRVKGAKMSYLANASKEMKQAAESGRESERNIKKKIKSNSAHPAVSFLNSSVKQKTDLYIKGNMFSNVDFHF